MQFVLQRGSREEVRNPLCILVNKLTNEDNKIKSALVSRRDRASFVAKCAIIDKVEKARNNQARI